MPVARVTPRQMVVIGLVRLSSQASGQACSISRATSTAKGMWRSPRRLFQATCAGLGMRLAANLSYFWYFRGHFSESRALRPPSWPCQRADLAGLRAELLHGIGLLALRQGDYPAARAYLDEGLAIARRVGDRRLRWWCYSRPPRLVRLAALGRVSDTVAGAASTRPECRLRSMTRTASPRQRAGTNQAARLVDFSSPVVAATMVLPR